MPTYVYECNCCGWGGDLYRSIDERDAPYPCPGCALKELRRIFVAPAVMLTALPDSTRRFDGVRASRQLERAIKVEKDKNAKAKLKRELRKLVTKEAG